MSKQGMRALKVELPSVNLRIVNVVVPRDPEEKEQLRQDLTKMGFAGLMEEPWLLRYEPLAQEFLAPRSNQWENTLRRDPDLWTADVWAKVYGFWKEGRQLAARTDHWIDGKFRSPINAKDGHAVEDCIDPRERRVLEFVVPIIYLEKPR